MPRSSPFASRGDGDSRWTTPPPSSLIYYVKKRLNDGGRRGERRKRISLSPVSFSHMTFTLPRAVHLHQVKWLESNINGPKSNTSRTVRQVTSINHEHFVFVNLAGFIPVPAMYVGYAYLSVRFCFYSKVYFGDDITHSRLEIRVSGSLIWRDWGRIHHHFRRHQPV